MTRAAIIADSPLKRHFYRVALSELGWQVEVHDLAMFDIGYIDVAQVSLWLVDAKDNEDIPDSLFELENVLFCDEAIPRLNSVGAIRLIRRLRERFASMGFGISGAPAPATIDGLPSKALAQSPDDIELVVAIAASAGGPKAVMNFLNALPAGLPVAFLYAQHIDAPCWQSLPAAVSGSHLNGELIVKDTELQAGSVHVVPVESILAYQGARRIKTTTTPWQGPYAPNLNQFLQAFGEHYRHRALAIVFSGMDNDGAQGVQALKQAGAKVWSQSSESAEQPSMPEAVANTGVVEYRGAPTDLANRLVQTIIARRRLG